MTANTGCDNRAELVDWLELSENTSIGFVVEFIATILPIVIP
jgi:hypothetical protein